MVPMSALIPSAESGTAREEMSATTPAAGSAEVPATSSAKVSVSEPPAVPAAVLVASLTARLMTASTGAVQVQGRPPGAGVAVTDERTYDPQCQ